MPVLHGVQLVLDEESAAVIGPWLDSIQESSTAPIVEVRVAAGGGFERPPVTAVLFEGARLWIGRTATGLIVGDPWRSWFSIEGSPPLIRGVIATGDLGAPRELFLRALLIAARKIGVYGLHAAAVCLDDRALVLVGDSGTGKSTTTTSLVSGGCRYLGDDALLIREHEADVELLAYSPRFRLTDQAVTSFPDLKPHLSKQASDDKWSLQAASAFPARFVANWRGKTTLLFLERSSRRSSALAATSLADATGLLISQSGALGLQCHPNPRQHLDLLARLAHRSHLARLELGTEWLEDPTGAAHRLIELAGSFL